MGKIEKITLFQEDIARCWNFASQIVRGGNQYDRMMKAGVSNEERIEYRIKRTFVGKIGEMAFYRFLSKRGINVQNFDAMFEIYPGEMNVDNFDFETSEGARVDVKTAVFANHKKLVVPLDQFLHMPKEYYVGVKLDLPANVRNYDKTFTVSCIRDVYIYGYATYDMLKQSRTINLGEFDCKAIGLDELNDINSLVSLF